MTDDNGTFTLSKRIRAIPNWPPPHWDTILNSSISSPVKKNDNFGSMLKPTAFEISEVVVKPKREKYTRKDNPAVELIKKVIAHKNDNRIEAKPNIKRKYTKKPKSVAG